MDTYFFHILILLSGFASAYVGMYVSGGISAISIGLLLTVGIPPHIANSTYLIGNIGSNIGGIRHFIQSGNYEKHYIVPMFFTMFIAGFIGSSFILDIPAQTIYRITGATFLFLALMTLLDRKQGIEKFLPTKTQELIGYILLFLTSVWSAIFPAGNGVFFYQIYTRFFGMTALVAKGQQKFVLFGLILGVLGNAFLHNIYIISYAVSFFIGMYLGGALQLKACDTALKYFSQKDYTHWDGNFRTLFSFREIVLPHYQISNLIQVFISGLMVNRVWFLFFWIG